MTTPTRRRAAAVRTVAAAVAAVLAGGCATHTEPAAHQAPAATAGSTGPAVPGGSPATTTGAPTVVPSGRPEPGSTAVYSVAPLPTGTAGTPRGSVPDTRTLRSASPDVVAAAGLSAYYSWRPAQGDTTRADAARRALPWLTGQLEQATRDYQPHAAPGADWNSWAAHHATLTVRVAPGADDGRPPDTATTAARQELVTITPTATGWTGAPVQFVDYVTLTRTPRGWRISTLAQNT